MFTIGSELKGYFDYDGLGLYLRAHETAEIDGVVVDLRNILDRRFFCDGSCCLRLSGPSCPSEKQVLLRGDCCQGPWVPLSAEEQERIAKHLEGILPYMAWEARAFVEAQVAKGKESKASFCRPVRDREGRDLGVTALRLLERNCIFRVLQREEAGPRVRCAIHGYCLAKGLAPWEVKPLYCWLFPLTIVPLYDGRFLLTVHTRETYQFTQEQKGQVTKPCLDSPATNGPWLYQAFAPELKHIFGEGFYQKLNALTPQMVGRSGRT